MDNANIYLILNIEYLFYIILVSTNEIPSRLRTSQPLRKERYQ